MQNKKQLLALVCETLRYGSVLSQIVENLKLLKTERFLKNDDSLAQALLYDFTIGKGLVRAGKLKVQFSLEVYFNDFTMKRSP